MTDSNEKNEDGATESPTSEEVEASLEAAADDAAAQVEETAEDVESIADDVASEIEATVEAAEEAIDEAKEEAESQSEELTSVLEDAVLNKEAEIEATSSEATSTVEDLRAQMSSSYQTQPQDSGMGLMPFMAAVVAMFLVAGGSIYYLVSGSGDGAGRQVAEADLQTTAAIVDAPEPDVSIEELMKTGTLPENSLGNENAPVTIVEYSSMTCPHCASFHEKTLPTLKEKYIDTGKVRYIIREFPLDNLAAAAFMLARCAGKDRYFPLIDALYAQQESWAYGKGDPTPRLFKATRLAGASFTKESFEACLQRQDLLDGINWVRERGGKFNIRSTPTFFINGRLLSGSQTIERFEEYMKPYLKDAK